MNTNNIWYEAGEIEANALRGPSWARPTTRVAAPRRHGARSAVGRALVGLGERIASGSRSEAARR